jgi:thymidylate kinase
MLIAFEGYDGSGKSTVAKRVSDALGVELMRFPRDEGVTGPLIRDHLRRLWHVRREPTAHQYDVGDVQWPARLDRRSSALVFQALQVTNRMEVMERLFQAEASPTDHLVLDRYWHSGWVYGQLDGLDPEFLRTVHRCMAQPDLCILVDACAEVCLERQRARAGAPERYDGHLEVARRAVELYRELWWKEVMEGSVMQVGLCSVGNDWVLLDGSQPVEDVVREALTVVRRVVGT